jgi:hypothetical protein
LPGASRPVDFETLALVIQVFCPPNGEIPPQAPFLGTADQSLIDLSQFFDLHQTLVQHPADSVPRGLIGDAKPKLSQSRARDRIFDLAENLDRRQPVGRDILGARIDSLEFRDRDKALSGDEQKQSGNSGNQR